MKPESQCPKGKVNYMGEWRDCIILKERKLYSIARIKDPKQFSESIVVVKPNQIRKN